MTKNAVHGYIPSSPDPRDYPVQQLLGAAVAPPKEDYRLIQHIETVFDQNPTNSCIWQSIAQAHWIRQGVQEVPADKKKRLSRLFGYYNNRVLHGAEEVDRGAVPNLAWAAAKKFGFCEEALWLFVPNRVNRKPDFDSYQGAIDQQWLKGYFQLFGLDGGRTNEVKQAIAAGYPVIFGTWVDTAFDDYYFKNQILGVPQLPFLGRHMMTAVAYDEAGLWVINSWGRWGDRDPTGRFDSGFFHMSWDWLEWPGLADIWALSFAEGFSR